MTNKVELVALDRAQYPNLSDTAFALLCRIAFLTSGTTEPITYTSKQVAIDLGIADRSAQRSAASLQDVGLIKIVVNGSKRTIALTAPIDIAACNQNANAAAAEAEATEVEKEAEKKPKLIRPIPEITVYEHIEKFKKLGYIVPNSYLRDAPNFLSYDREPALVSLRTGMWKIDLSRAVELSGMDLRPFGYEHSFHFDFEPLKDILRPTLSQMDRIIDMYPDFNGFNWAAPHFYPLLKEFFIMSMVVELTSGLGECFKNPQDFDPFGNNFYECWYNNQRGLLFSALNSCYPDPDIRTDGLIKRIKLNINPTQGDIVKYALGTIRNEVVSLLNNEVTASKCFGGFIDAFYKYAVSQAYVENAGIVVQKNRNWLEGYWGPNLASNLLNYSSVYYIPRISWPMLMFRTLIGMTEIGELRAGPSQDRSDRAASVLIRAYMDAPYRDQLATLGDVLGPYFPFFYKIADYQKQLVELEF